MAEDRELDGQEVPDESLDSTAGGIIFMDLDEGGYVVVDDKDGSFLYSFDNLKDAEKYAKEEGLTIEVAPHWQYKYRFPGETWI